jgi:hypothetical protein
MKKYEITTEQRPENFRLFRIRALTTIPGVVKAGELGGWIEQESNLSRDGTCWVAGDASVRGNAQVCGDAKVYGEAQVSGSAIISGNAIICDNALVSGDAKVYGDAGVFGAAQVYGNAHVNDHARVYGAAQVYGEAQVYDRAKVHLNADVHGSALIRGSADIHTERDVLHLIGLRYPLTITPQNVVGGCRLFTHDEFRKLTLLNCQDREWTEEELQIYKSVLELYSSSRPHTNETLGNPRHSPPAR